MIIPYSTDAPIYHFPWMTIVLIVLNCASFAITGMGNNSEGWLLQYGNGLHPVEWVAYNFLHFGVSHLLGNMFFLWAFGIVVEGKLGWWKFLSVYMGIGIVGGFLIQVTMLGYKPDPLLDIFSEARENSSASWFEPTPAFAQEDGIPPDMDDDDGGGMLPPGAIDEDGMNPDDIAAENEADDALRRILANRFKPGAGGASLAVFALLGIVLVWAPKNEVSCLWIGLNAGTFEVEYIYFCGLKIGTEILGAVLGGQGYEVTSEIAHALGAVLGFGIGAAFIKLNWVDCENWDLFAYAQNKHGSMEHVGSWQDAQALNLRTNTKISTPSSDDEDEPRVAKKKKKRPVPKLKAISSLDDEIPDDDFENIEIIEEDADPQSGQTAKTKAAKAKPARDDAVSEPPSKKGASKTVPPQNGASPLPSSASKVTGDKPSSQVHKPEPTTPGSSPQDATPIDEIRRAIKSESWNAALSVLRRCRSADESFRLPITELRLMADGFFKQQNVRDSRPLLEEFIERFPAEADRQRIKLAVLFVKYLQMPTAALKLLVQVDKSSLPEEYLSIHKEAARKAQDMISNGITDAV